MEENKGYIAAFTLVEVLVVLVITAVLILLSYWALNQFNQSFLGLRTKLSHAESRMEFERQFQSLWNQSDSVFYQQSELQCWIGSDLTIFQFSDSVHVTRFGHQLSFKLDSCDFVPEQYLSRPGRDSLVQSAYLRTYSKQGALRHELHFYKHYAKPLY